LNPIEVLEANNNNLIAEMKNLTEIENSRASICSAMFVKINGLLRFNNRKAIRDDIHASAKSYGVKPEKYASSEESIINAYTEPINKFMQAYNQEFINIKMKLYSAEEEQKKLMFEIKKIGNIRKLYIITKQGDNPKVLEYEAQLKILQKKIETCEKIVILCDREFLNCKERREKQFKEIFDIDSSIIVMPKMSFLKKFAYELLGKFKGYDNFSKNVLKKYAVKINTLKAGKIDEYLVSVKQTMINFNAEIEKLKEEV
jgi:hypothetical protein